MRLTVKLFIRIKLLLSPLLPEKEKLRIFFTGWALFLLFLSSSLLPAEETEEEKHRFIVNTIHFVGNSFITDLKLLEEIRTQPGFYYDRQIANDDSKRIAEVYDRLGYHNVKVLYPEPVPLDSQNIDLYFHIEEQKPYLINEFNISGNTYIRTGRIFQSLGYSRGGEYTLETVNRFLVDITDLYASRGFLFTKAELDSIVVNKKDIDEKGSGNDYLPVIAYINIDEGRYSRFENFIFEGNEVTTDKTLMRISGLGRLDHFTLDKLRLAEDNVRRKEYINDFTITPINYKTLLLEVDEGRMTHLSGMLGYDTFQEDRSRRLTGFVNLRLLNLYGTDRSFALSWQRLRPERESVELRYYESGPFDFPVAGEFSLYRETVDSTYIVTKIDSEIYYYSLRNKYGLFIGSEDIFPGTRRPIIVEKQSYNKIGLFWRYNSADYFLNPTSGMSFDAKHYYILHREREDWISKQVNELHWTNYTQITTSGNSLLSRPLVFMLSLNVKQIQDKDLQEYELFGLGGINDIRGFREDQFEGYRVFWANTELRYLLSRKSRLFLFTDYGYVEMTKKDKALNDLIGVGLGVRLDTRIGLIGVDYGFSHSEGDWMHPLDGMVHFGIETRF